MQCRLKSMEAGKLAQPLIETPHQFVVTNYLTRLFIVVTIYLLLMKYEEKT